MVNSVSGKLSFMSENNKKIKLVAIAKDEARYISEWIYHHDYFGFDSFDVYVNNTSDNTVEILTKLAENYDINIINADDLYQQDPSKFQVNAYNQSLNSADSDTYSHIAFWDIDEFWTPRDFTSTIHKHLEKINNYDVALFNWAIHRSESEFGNCFSDVNEFISGAHVKSIVKVGCLARAGIHNAYGKNLSYKNSESLDVEFMDDAKAQIKINSDEIPSAFLVHRLYRSQLEYVSMLSRGRPRGDRFKSNRSGYYLNNKGGYQFEINPDILSGYYSGFNAIIANLGLATLVGEAEEFVINRYQQLLETVKTGVTYSEAKVLSNALKNINIAEVKDAARRLDEQVKSMKIFQIGFNKSGTASIYHYLKSEGFKAVHWDDGNLSKTLKSNFESGLDLLTGYEDFQVFTDMEHWEDDDSAFYGAEQYFRQLDQQYPNSIFILNYRDVDKWVQSRKNHPGYLQKTVNSTGLTPEEVVENWKNSYYRHIASVKEYFEDKSNLIVLVLDKDDSQKLYCELYARGIELSQTELPHTHKTKVDQSERDKHVNSIRDAALFFESDDIEVAYMLMKVAQQLRPEGRFIERKLQEFEDKLVSND
ncbi:TPA: glycosyltransferase family 2 protein [Vibrio parahaemolyticus]|nr:glycosyltransferase family 2 protein [Vibrio parahaemolyticus]